MARLRAAVPEADVLVVDDGSPDGTGDDRRPAGRRGRRPCTCCTGPEKAGLGAAYIAGFRWALADGYDVVVEMDADGSHAPEELPRLLDRAARRRPGHRLPLGARRRRSATGRCTG